VWRPCPLVVAGWRYFCGLAFPGGRLARARGPWSHAKPPETEHGRESRVTLGPCGVLRPSGVNESLLWPPPVPGRGPAAPEGLFRVEPGPSRAVTALHACVIPPIAETYYAVVLEPLMLPKILHRVPGPASKLAAADRELGYRSHPVQPRTGKVTDQAYVPDLGAPTDYLTQSRFPSYVGSGPPGCGVSRRGAANPAALPTANRRVT